MEVDVSLTCATFNMQEKLHATHCEDQPSDPTLATTMHPREGEESPRINGKSDVATLLSISFDFLSAGGLY